MLGYRNKRSLRDIAIIAPLPFLAQHYTAGRKKAMITGLDGNEFVGYYEGTPTIERRWPADAIEWVLLTYFKER